jgi:hypothetical protein
MQFNILHKTFKDNRNDCQWYTTLEWRNGGTYSTHLYNENEKLFVDGAYYDNFHSAYDCYLKRLGK